MNSYAILVEGDQVITGTKLRRRRAWVYPIRDDRVSIEIENAVLPKCRISF